MLSKEHVVDMFSYNDEEQRAFSYLRIYMQKILTHRAKLDSDVDMLERFMLAGLFLTYRAFNHQGLDITTGKIDSLSPGIDKQRLLLFKTFTGKDIHNSEEYLRLIRFNYFKFLLLGPGNALYRFVLYGH